MSNETSTLLIVDDKPNNRYTLKLLLEPLNITVAEADSGEEALKLVMHQTFFPDSHGH